MGAPSAAALAAAVVPTLADATLKATVVLAAAYALTRWGMRHASAATRHLVWSAAVGAVLALPLLGALVPHWSLPLVPAAAAERAGRMLAAAAQPEAGSVQTPAPTGEAAATDARRPGGLQTPGPGARHASGTSDGTSAPSFVEPATPSPGGRSVTTAARTATAVRASTPGVGAAPPGTPTPAWPLWVAGVWAAGAALALLRVALGTVGLARLARGARPADDPAWVTSLQRLARQLGVRRPVTLLVGRAGAVPVTWGVVYPVVLLPADAAEWGEERRRLVLLHELAHVVRLDALTQVLARLAGAVFWFNPLAALAARRLRAERERACDDLVLAAAGVRATAYADDLLDLVRTLGGTSPAAAALAMARRSEFEGRLLAILDPAAPRARTSTRRALAAAAAAAAVAMPLAGVRASVAARSAAAPNVTPRGTATPTSEPRRATGPAAHSSTTGPAAPTVTAPASEPTWTYDANVSPLPPAGAQVPVGGAGAGMAPPSPQPPAPPTPPRPASVRAPTVDGCGRAPSEAVGDGAAHTSTYRSVADGHCVEVVVRGTVDFTSDATDVRTIAAGGAVVVTESAGGLTRRMTVVPVGGGLARTYTINDTGRPAAEGSAWFRRVLADVVARGELGAARRAARLPEGSGTAALLDAARRATDDARRQEYLTMALAEPALSTDELEETARAAQGIASDQARAAILARVAARGAGNANVVTAVVGAARTISVDGAHRRVLEQSASGPPLPPAVLADLVRSTASMTSDSDKAAVLTRLAPRLAESAALRAAFFDVVAAFTSDAERRRVLVAATAGSADPAVLAAVLDATAPMTSDAERATVLTAVVDRGALEPTAVLPRYFARVTAITSDLSREQALLAPLAPLSRGTSSDAIVRAVLASATSFSSDHARANVLLGVATRTDALRRPETRAAFLTALQPMASSAEYRRVMEAVVPR